MSAVSNRVTPAARAASTIRLHACSSGLPHRPNIIVPNASVLTSMPLLPNCRYCIVQSRPACCLNTEAVPVVDAMGDATLADDEPHDAAHRDRAIVDSRAQGVRRAHPVALGDDVLDVVAQARHRRQEARQALAVLDDADATTAERGGVLVDEVVGDERGDRVGVAGARTPRGSRRRPQSARPSASRHPRPPAPWRTRPGRTRTRSCCRRDR